MSKGFLQTEALSAALRSCLEEESRVDGPSGVVQEQGHGPPGDMKAPGVLYSDWNSLIHRWSEKTRGATSCLTLT